MCSERDNKQQRAEIDARHDLKNYLDTIIQTSHDGILVIDSEGRFEFGNEAFFRIFGWPADELIGHNFIKVVPPDKHEFILQRWEEVQAGKGEPYEVDIVRKNGDRRSLLVSHRHMTIAGQRKYCVITKDVTESKQAEKALRESAELNSKIISNSPIGIAIYDKTGQCVAANEAMGDVVGSATAKVLEQNYNNIDSWRKSGLLNAAKLAIQEGETQYRVSRVTSTFGKNLGVECYFVPFAREGDTGLMLMVTDITKRQEIEEALRKSEERYRDFVEGTQDLITRVDDTGHFVYVNHMAEKIFGVKDTDCVGRMAFEFIHPDDRERTVKWFNERVNNHHRQSSIENRQVNQVTGKVSHILWTKTLRYDESGGIAGINGIGHDITERKQAQDALHASQERFRQVAEHAREWIWEVDTDGLYTYASPVVKKILGYSPEEVVGKKHFYDLFHPEHRQETKTAALELFARQESFWGLLNLNVHRNGRAVWLSTSGVAVFDKAGTFIGYRGADVDVTEHKRDQEAVKFLSAVTRQASDSVIATNLNFEITYINKSFERLYGYSKAEVLGKYPSMLNADPNADMIQSDIREKISTGGTWEGEVRNRRKDGSVFHCEMMVSPLLDGEGQVFAYAGRQRDITERIQVEEELSRYRSHLEEMVKMRTEELTQAQETLRKVHRRLLNAGESERRSLAANLHDSAGQKLVAMALGIQQTIFSCQDTGAHEAQIQALKGIAQQCTGTIQEIRTICYGLYPPMLEITGLEPSLRQLGKSCQPAVEFHLTCDEELSEARFDPEQEIALFRIAQEAVSNALRHGDAANITVNLSGRDGMITMTVVDDGVGFDTASALGQGLGLRSMTERARAADGSLTIISEPGLTSIEASVRTKPRSEPGS